MKTKKWMALFLSLVMVTTLFAGCAADPVPGDDSPSDSKDKGKSSQVSIEVLFWDPEDMDSSTKVMNEFRAANTDVTLDFQYMSGSGLAENIQARVTANNLPDFFSMSANAYAYGLADEGYLADVSDTKAWDNMYDSLKENFTSPGGVKFGASNGLGIIVMYVNEELFKSIGEEVPTNLEELLAVSKKFNDAGIAPLAMAGAHASSLQHALGCTLMGVNGLATGGNMEQIKEGKYDYASADFMDAMNDVQALVDNKCFQEGFMGTDYNGMVNLFLDGKAAMMINGTWLAAQALAAEFEVSMQLVPFNEAGSEQASLTIPETGQVLSAKSSAEKLTAAKRLLDYFYGEGYQYFQNPRGCIPPMAEENYPGPIVLADQTMAFLEKSNSVTNYQHSSLYVPAGVYAEISKQLQSLMSGGSTVDSVAVALNDAQAAG